LEEAIQALRVGNQKIDDNLLKKFSLLGCEYINLSEDYIWNDGKKKKRGKFRPLRPIQNP